VAIHRVGCSDFNRQAKLFPHKVTQVSWANTEKGVLFSTDLEIIANDRHGLLRDLTDLFAIEKLNIIGLRTVCRNNKAIMTFTIQVGGGEFNFNWLLGKVFNINGVIEVMRK
jgi:GTP pyrophosphokinase